jgi:3D (Asp-Asp-Asp) domain-containing protein
MRSILALWAIYILSSTVSWGRTTDGLPLTQTFIATAYAQKGQTASGAMTHVGLVAADPAVLPLGSRIRITGAGDYSGEYLVADTGALVKGRHIDIFMPSRAEAIKFGKQRVMVQIRRIGNGKRFRRNQETSRRAQPGSDAGLFS